MNYIRVSSELRHTDRGRHRQHTAGKRTSRRVGHINGLMFAPALLMQFLKRYIGLGLTLQTVHYRKHKLSLIFHGI